MLTKIGSGGPFDAVLYAATTVRSPLDITIQLECCRRWLAGSQLGLVGAFSDDAGRKIRLDKRQGFEALLRTVRGGASFVVVSSFSDLAGTKDLVRQAVSQVTRAGATILSATTRSALAVDGAVEPIEDLLQMLGLQGEPSLEDLAFPTFATLIEAHLEEVTRRRHEDFRRWLAAESRSRSHRATGGRSV